MCLLDVPVNKTTTAFTKPVDRIVGDAVKAWELERPTQPAALDEKTGELVHFLFSVRCARFSPSYLNRTLIPSLCRKGWRASERCAWTYHEPSGALDDRDAAL